MAQLMPLVRPSAHNDSAAEIWSLGLATDSRPLRATSLASVTDRPRWRFSGLLDDTSNQPETPVYRPCLAMTVAGSKAAQASALPPNSRAMVCALVPASGPMLPAMSTKELNNSGCMTVRSSAHIPPIDQPTMPQRAGSGLTPNFEIMYGTTSLVRWSAAFPRIPLTHSVSLLNAPPESTKTNTGALPPCLAASSSIIFTALPARAQSAGVLNSPPIIITVGSGGGGLLENHAGGK